MTTSWISFGPDLEPLESEARRGAHTASSRRDGVCVSGTPEEVTAKLVEANASGGWCRLEEVPELGERRPVFVNPRTARMVVEDVQQPH